MLLTECFKYSEWKLLGEEVNTAIFSVKQPYEPSHITKEQIDRQFVEWMKNWNGDNFLGAAAHGYLCAYTAPSAGQGVRGSPKWRGSSFPEQRSNPSGGKPREPGLSEPPRWVGTMPWELGGDTWLLGRCVFLCPPLASPARLHFSLGSPGWSFTAPSSNCYAKRREDVSQRIWILVTGPSIRGSGDPCVAPWRSHASHVVSHLLNSPQLCPLSGLWHQVWRVLG